MTLNGIDTSSYQRGLNAGTLAGIDFVIAKATGGTGYVNRPACNDHMTQAAQAGRKRGCYHFAHDSGGTGSPQAEADHFLTNIHGYVGTTLLALDFEAADLINHASGVGWAHEWLTRVHSQTGVKPLIYMPGWVVSAYDWSPVVNDDYGLWLAYWPRRGSAFDNEPLPAVKHWPTLAMWQFTDRGRLHGWSADLDLDRFTGDARAWDLYAAVGGKPAPRPAPKPAPVPVPVVHPTSKDFLDMSAFNQYNRTTDQTFNKGDSRVLRLSNTNDVTFGFGGGKYLATFRLAFTGLAPGEDFRVTPYYVDTDHAGKTVGNPHLFPTVGVPGTFGATWGQVVFDYDVPAPKSGLTRRLRLRGDYAGAKPVTVTSINTTVRKAALA